jgi:hypothetical protein
LVHTEYPAPARIEEREEGVNKAWVRHDATDGVCAIEETVFPPNTQQTHKKYLLQVYLSGGQTLRFNFATEEEQKSAYEEYKPEAKR